jgi:hypothetical protein
MTPQELIKECRAHGVTLLPGTPGKLKIRPASALPTEMKATLRANKADILHYQRVQLEKAPPADCLGDDPCPICGSRERWQWLDGRARCWVCLVLDLVPMTLAPAMTEQTRRRPDEPHPSA